MAKRSTNWLLLLFFALLCVLAVHGQTLPENNDGSLVEEVVNERLVEAQAEAAKNEGSNQTQTQAIREANASPDRNLNVELPTTRNTVPAAATPNANANASNASTAQRQSPQQAESRPVTVNRVGVNTTSAEGESDNANASTSIPAPPTDPRNPKSKHVALKLSPYTLGMQMKRQGAVYVVQSVAPGSDGAAAGFRVGDEIASIGGDLTTNMTEAAFYDKIRAGVRTMELNITRVRGAEMKTLKVDVLQGWSLFGITFAQYKGNEYHCGNETNDRIVVSNVVPGSPAFEGGITVGDVVIAINHMPTVGMPLNKSNTVAKGTSQLMIATLPRSKFNCSIIQTMEINATKALRANIQRLLDTAREDAENDAIDNKFLSAYLSWAKSVLDKNTACPAGTDCNSEIDSIQKKIKDLAKLLPADAQGHASSKAASCRTVTLSRGANDADFGLVLNSFPYELQCGQFAQIVSVRDSSPAAKHPSSPKMKELVTMVDDVRTCDLNAKEVLATLAKKTKVTLTLCPEASSPAGPVPKACSYCIKPMSEVCKMVSIERVYQKWGFSVKKRTPDNLAPFKYFVSSVDEVAGNPAFTAGLKYGDFLRVIGERDVSQASIKQLHVALAVEAGQKLVLKVTRGKKTLTVTLRRSRTEFDAKNLLQGLDIGIRSVGCAGFPAVRKVEPASEGSLTALKAGDVIFSINGNGLCNQEIEEADLEVQKLESMSVQVCNMAKMKMEEKLKFCKKYCPIPNPEISSKIAKEAPVEAESSATPAVQSAQFGVQSAQFDKSEGVGSSIKKKNDTVATNATIDLPKAVVTERDNSTSPEMPAIYVVKDSSIATPVSRVVFKKRLRFGVNFAAAVQRGLRFFEVRKINKKVVGINLVKYGDELYAINGQNVDDFDDNGGMDRVLMEANTARLTMVRRQPNGYVENLEINVTKVPIEPVVSTTFHQTDCGTFPIIDEMSAYAGKKEFAKLKGNLIIKINSNAVCRMKQADMTQQLDAAADLDAYIIPALYVQSNEQEFCKSYNTNLCLRRSANVTTFTQNSICEPGYYCKDGQCPAGYTKVENYCGLMREDHPDYLSKDRICLPGHYCPPGHQCPIGFELKISNHRGYCYTKNPMGPHHGPEYRGWDFNPLQG